MTLFPLKSRSCLCALIKKCILNHSWFSGDCETDVKRKGKNIYTHSLIRSHSVLFKGRLCLLVRAKFMVNPFVLPGKPSGQVWCWGTGSQHSWREDGGGWGKSCWLDPRMPERGSGEEKCERVGRGRGERRGRRRVGGGWTTPGGFSHPCSRWYSIITASIRASRWEKYPQVAEHPSPVVSKWIWERKRTVENFFLSVWAELDELPLSQAECHWEAAWRLSQVTTAAAAAAAASTLADRHRCSWR